MHVDTKIALVNELLSEGKISVGINPCEPTRTLDLPKFVLDSATSHIVLDLGLNMPVPIPDLQITPTGIYATLSFNRTPHLCFIPWEAIFHIRGESTQIVWTENIPAEPPKLAAGSSGKAVKTSGTAKKKPSHLKLVE